MDTDTLRKIIERPWLPHVVGGTVDLTAERIHFKRGGSIKSRKLGEVAALLWMRSKMHEGTYNASVNNWLLTNSTIIHI